MQGAVKGTGGGDGAAEVEGLGVEPQVVRASSLGFIFVFETGAPVERSFI